MDLLEAVRQMYGATAAEKLLFASRRAKGRRMPGKNQRPVGVGRSDLAGAAAGCGRALCAG